MRVVEIAGEGKKLGCSLVVGRHAFCGCGWLDFGELHVAGSGFDRAVDEEHGLGMRDVFGDVGGPLLAGDYLDAGIFFEPLLSPLSKPGADAVVTAESVAACEDENTDPVWTHRWTV